MASPAATSAALGPASKIQVGSLLIIGERKRGKRVLDYKYVCNVWADASFSYSLNSSNTGINLTSITVIATTSILSISMQILLKKRTSRARLSSFSCNCS